MTDTAIESWEQLLHLIEAEDTNGLKEFFDALPASESVWALSHLDEGNQKTRPTSRKIGPPLVSSPVLTTITDMCGFFFVLSFASTAMDFII